MSNSPFLEEHLPLFVATFAFADFLYYMMFGFPTSLLDNVIIKGALFSYAYWKWIYRLFRGDALWVKAIYGIIWVLALITLLYAYSVTPVFFIVLKIVYTAGLFGGAAVTLAYRPRI